MAFVRVGVYLIDESEIVAIWTDARNLRYYIHLRGIAAPLDITRTRDADALYVRIANKAKTVDELNEADKSSK